MIDYEKIREERLRKARSIVSQKNKALSTYVKDLFALGLAEDLARYEPAAIATFASKSYKTLTTRKAGQPVIEFNRYEAVAQHLDGSKKSITTIDIVNDNMPFLIDSIVPELRDLGHDIRLIAHPIFSLERTSAGKLKAPPILFKSNSRSKATRESVMHIHINAITTSEERKIKAALTKLLKDVRGVVKDWPKMTAKVKQTIQLYKDNPPPIEVDKLAEAVQFLEWLSNNNFTFLGIRAYDYNDKAARFVQPIKGSGLGILRNPNMYILRRGDELVEITPEIREFITSPEPLIISKANVKSQIHRRIHMDYIGIKLYDKKGKVTGELRFVGLFTSTAYACSINAIPYVRHKAQSVMQTSGLDPSSHSGKALWNVLESYPRDEIFQIGTDLLQDFALSILALDGRKKVRVLPRWDKFDRYVSVMVFVPRERYNTNVRIRIGEYLADIFNGEVSVFYPGFPEGLLARAHFIIRRNKGKRPVASQADLELVISALVETWEDSLKDAIEGTEISDKPDAYTEAFSAAYREAFPPINALHDIEMVERLESPDSIEAEFYARADMTETCIGLKLFHLKEPIELSTRVPMLENMGFRVVSERTYQIEPADHPICYLHDMALQTVTGAPLNLGECRNRLEDTLQAIWQNQTGNDGYNALSVNACLKWRDIAVLRTISRYLQQIAVTYSQDYMWKALNNNADITLDLVALFYARFDPNTKGRDKQQAIINKRIDNRLEAVTSLDEDQIIRWFRKIILGSLRTNFFKRDEEGNPIPEVSLKLAPREIAGLPEPRPYREIFMTSPRVEGLHLRYGKVARGGLRWSDRPEDFRTEVLGLVKAQQVKNAVIVPVGSKGGFVPKKLTPTMSRDEFIKEGTEAYKIFIANLLELTDNLDGNKVINPNNVVRHEGDDPYLVVAADKGTATFSDTANGISQDYEFWLDDAFASGGSAGYDHKKMGITARGAWEAVKRHFREMDKDIQSEPFTAAGVGDMSGDVFGNGMLLSKTTKLVAAFDHRDIFIDPNPDPASSFKERKRLFKKGRSSWQDYDKKLLSKGGAIFPRSLKSIKLTPEIKELLDVSEASLSPFELLRAIVKMDVELFWFGGIGTYIRGPLETDADAGDRANDPIRIEAAELRAKVIGEGANLGMTQRARIAYNKQGGRCNSDAVDNSAGVNSSDVEVNIKIALGAAVRAGKLTIPARNKLLEEMTDDVAELVLRNNYQQTLSISLTKLAGITDFDNQTRYMQELEARGLLDRAVEDLPNDTQLEERRHDGDLLTRAEIGVVMAYAKITLFDDLIDSKVPDDPYLESELFRYFPPQMQKKYATEIKGHKLRREIIATLVCNAMINRGGATYLERVQGQTGARTPDIARAYIVAREAFQMQSLNARLDALDTKINGTKQLELYSVLRRILSRQTVWILKNIAFKKGIAPELAPLVDGIKALKPKLMPLLPDYLKESVEKRESDYLAAQIPKDIAKDFALLPVLDLAPNIIKICGATKRPLNEGAAVYFELDGMFKINKIDAMAGKVETADYYDGLALSRGRAQLSRAHSDMTQKVISKHKGANAATSWYKANKEAIDDVLDQLDDILESETLSVAKLSVAANLLEDLTRR